MRRISLFAIAGLIAILVFTGVNSFQTLTSAPDSATAAVQLDYDAYSEGINTVLYDATGAINYTLQATRQVHFNDDSTELEQPFIRLYEAGSSRWNIVANSGRISSLYDGSTDTSGQRVQTIELTGDIEVYSLDQSGSRMQMTTDFLTINPRQRIMETDRLVTVVTDAFNLTSTGMYADLEQDSVVFIANTQGFYESGFYEAQTN